MMTLSITKNVKNKGIYRWITHQVSILEIIFEWNFICYLYRMIKKNICEHITLHLVYVNTAVVLSTVKVIIE